MFICRLRGVEKRVMIIIKKLAADYIITFLVFFLVCSLYLSGVFETVEQKIIDWRFLYNQQAGESQNIIVVEITGDCLKSISAWPVKRGIIAAAIDKIMSAGARSMALDILFADKTNEREDGLLREVIRKYDGKMVLAAQLVENISALPDNQSLLTGCEFVRPHETLGIDDGACGLINIDYHGLNKDGAVRTINLFTMANGVRYNSLALAGALNYMKSFPAGIFSEKIISSSAPFLVNYYRPYRDSYFTRIAFSSLLADDTNEIKDIVSGKLVFLGVSAPAVPDMRLTPFGVMPGVEIHASAAANIIENNYASRNGYCTMISILILFTVALFFYLRNFRAVYDIPVIVLLYGFYCTIVLIAVAKYRAFIDLLPPLVLMLVLPICFRFYQNIRQVYISNEELQRMLERIGGLYNIAKLSQEQSGLQELLNITVVEMSKILKCKRISIVIEDPKSKSLVLKAAVGFSESDKPVENLILNRRSPIVSKVMETASPVLVQDVDECGRFETAENVNYKTRSFVCVPVIISGNAVGALSLTDKQNKEKFTSEDLKTIVVFANQISSNIEHIFNIETQMERRRLDKELEIASEMQKKLVPSGIKNIACYEIFGSYIPAREVSGDYYDCIELDENRFLLLTGDVSGKGVPAGLFMMTVRTFLHTIIKYEHDLTKIIGDLNNYLTDNSEAAAYLTIFMCILDTTNGNIEYVNGGHLSPYLIRKNGEIETFEVKNLICGMFNDVVYNRGMAKLEPGDAIFIVTDGITEAQAADESMYGDKALKNAIASLDLNLNAAEQVKSILKSVKDFVKGAPQSDDITILSIKALERK